MAIDSLEKLLIHELKDLYSAERQLVRALPRMAKAATSGELAESFRQHLEETRRQAEQLEEVLRLLGSNTRGEKCAAMEGLIEEGRKLIEEEELEPALLDAALVGAAQKVEHYEIAGYGTAREMAENLGRSEVAQALDRILSEEKATDEKLTQLARQAINPAALATAEGSEESDPSSSGRRASASGGAQRVSGRGTPTGAAGRTAAAAAGGRATATARASQASGVGGKGGKRGSSGGADSRTRSSGGGGRTKNR